MSFVTNLAENSAMTVKLIYAWIASVSMLVSSSFQSHDIVHLKNRNIHAVFPDCKTHLSQRCEVYCKKCHEPICIKCSIGRHKTHDISELEELVEIRKREIEKEVEELESKIIPKFQEANAMISNKIDYVATFLNKN